MKTKFVLFAAISILLVLVLPGCNRGAGENGGTISVLVFIPGVVAGSPTYEMMVDGVMDFAGENDGINVRIYEAGFN